MTGGLASPSCRLPKMDCPTSSALDVSRSRDEPVDAPQDFSLPSKSKKSRLDDMLDKIMKRKVGTKVTDLSRGAQLNCLLQQEEPQGKEKKRRKLDEIVMGLSSAREQQQQAHTSPAVAELMKKTSASISVVGATNTSPAHQQPPSHLPPPPSGATLHPLLRPHLHKGSPTPSNHPPTTAASNKAPFTITVTSVPSSSSSSSQRAPPPPMPPISSAAACKDTFSLLPQPDLAASLALLTGATSKKPGMSQAGKATSSSQAAAAAAAAYEAVLADMNKMADLSAKVSSYSHEAKVSLWSKERSDLKQHIYLTCPQWRSFILYT